jgi:hypothetical protein
MKVGHFVAAFMAFVLASMASFPWPLAIAVLVELDISGITTLIETQCESPPNGPPSPLCARAPARHGLVLPGSPYSQGWRVGKRLSGPGSSPRQESPARPRVAINAPHALASSSPTDVLWERSHEITRYGDEMTRRSSAAAKTGAAQLNA